MVLSKNPAMNISSGEEGGSFPAQIKLMAPTPCICALQIKIALSDYPGGRSNTSHSRLLSLYSVSSSSEPMTAFRMSRFSFWSTDTIRTHVRYSFDVPISGHRELHSCIPYS